MLPADVKQRIESGLKSEFVEVTEFSGGTDHYSVIVVSEEFQGVPLLKRHRMVMDLFKPELATEEVHALTIKAYTTSQWEVEKDKPRFF